MYRSHWNRWNFNTLWVIRELVTDAKIIPRNVYYSTSCYKLIKICLYKSRGTTFSFVKKNHRKIKSKYLFSEFPTENFNHACNIWVAISNYFCNIQQYFVCLPYKIVIKAKKLWYIWKNKKSARFTKVE